MSPWQPAVNCPRSRCGTGHFWTPCPHRTYRFSWPLSCFPGHCKGSFSGRQVPLLWSSKFLCRSDMACRSRNNRSWCQMNARVRRQRSPSENKSMRLTGHGEWTIDSPLSWSFDSFGRHTISKRCARWIIHTIPFISKGPYTLIRFGRRGVIYINRNF